MDCPVPHCQQREPAALGRKLSRFRPWLQAGFLGVWLAPLASLAKARELFPDFPLAERLVAAKADGDKAEASKTDFTNAPQPEGIAVDLYPFQRAGVKFALNVFNQKGGSPSSGVLIADSMGLRCLEKLSRQFVFATPRRTSTASLSSAQHHSR